MPSTAFNTASAITRRIGPSVSTSRRPKATAERDDRLDRGYSREGDP